MERTIRLPIGRTDFREIREGSCYYIDKTENIGRIIRDGAKSILFTRPRRFGKTTFQSMLRAFFDIREDSRDIFSGLAVMNDKEAAESWMNRYPWAELRKRSLYSEYCAFRAVSGLWVHQDR